MEKINPPQAKITRTAIQSAGGREDVCSICGEEPAPEYLWKDAPTIVNTMRLCDDCRDAQKLMHGGAWELLPEMNQN